jgi:hypothetical protein
VLSHSLRPSRDGLPSFYGCLRPMQIFLSYAREDLPAATALYRALIDEGFSVWFDRESLQPGDRWKQVISTAIRNSRYFLALLSTHSSSKRGFVQAEVKQALAVFDEFPETESYVIPVRLDDSTPSHPRLSELQWVDLHPHWQDGIDKLLRFFRAKSSGLVGSAINDLPGDTAATEPLSQGVRELRYSGLYQSKGTGSKERGYSHFVRFFEDGIVITATSSGTPQDLARWFTKEFTKSKYGQSGRFFIDGSLLRFSSFSREGSVDYEGEILADGLILRSHSHINGYRGISEYKFRKLKS